MSLKSLEGRGVLVPLPSALLGMEAYKLDDISVTLFSKQKPCGYLFYACPFCPFWVGVVYTSALTKHIRQDHMQSWNGVKTTLIARPVRAQRGPHIYFPQFSDTSVDDNSIFSSIRVSLNYQKKDEFVSIPYIKIVHFKTKKQHYICPYCQLVETVETTIKAHLPLHLTLNFIVSTHLRRTYCTYCV
jgi:hypothetical protein